MKIKICGLTNIQDAHIAYLFGAKELGFILAKSPRQICVMTLKNIISNLPCYINMIGVFANENPNNILEIIKATKLSGVQLHGQETNEEIEYLKKNIPNLFIIKTIGVNDHHLLLSLTDY